MNEQQVPSSSWLSIGKSFQAGLAVVPISSVRNDADETHLLTNDADSGREKNESRKRRDQSDEFGSDDSSFASSLSSSSDSSDDHRKRKKSYVKKKSSKEKRERKEHKHSRHHHKKEKKEKKKKDHKDRKHDDKKSKKTKYKDEDRQVAIIQSPKSVEIFQKEALSTLMIYQDEFDTSTDDEADDVKSNQLQLSIAPKQQDLPESNSWKIDKAPDMDIPLFMDFKYFPLPLPQSEDASEFNSGKVQSGVVVSKVNADLSKTDRIFQQSSQVISFSDYLHQQKKRRYHDSHMPKDERYFARSQRKVLLDPNATKIILRAKSKQGQLTSTGMGFIPLPVLGIEELIKDEAELGEVVSIETDGQSASRLGLSLTKEFNIAMRIAEEASNLRGPSVDAVFSILPHLRYASKQLELFQLQQLSIGKPASNILQSISLLPRETPTTVKERQMDIVQQALEKLHGYYQRIKSEPKVPLVKQEVITSEIMLVLQALFHYKCSNFTPQQSRDYWNNSIQSYPELFKLYYKQMDNSATHFTFCSHKEFKQNFLHLLTKLKEYATKVNAEVVPKKRVSRFSLMDQDQGSTAQQDNNEEFDYELTYATMDLLFNKYLPREKSMDHWEQVVAYIQAMSLYASPQLRLMHYQNMQNLDAAKKNSAEVEKLEQYWEGEWIRPGEAMGIVTVPGSDGQLVEQPSVEVWRDDYNSMQQQATVLQKFVSMNALIPPSPPVPQDVEPMPAVSNARPQSAVSDTATTNEPLASTGGEWVYSRVHGYKIFIKHQEDDKLYKHILEDLGKHEIKDDDLQDNNEENPINPSAASTEMKEMQENTRLWNEIDWSTDIFAWSYYRDYICRHLQYYPLRGLHPLHADLVERQPERLAFFSEDIAPLLLSLPPLFGGSSKAITGEISVQYLRFYRQLVLRSLATLGLEIADSSNAAVVSKDGDLDDFAPLMIQQNKSSYFTDWMVRMTLFFSQFNPFNTTETISSSIAINGISLSFSVLREIVVLHTEDTASKKQLPKSKVQLILGMIESVMAELVAIIRPEQGLDEVSREIRQTLSQLRSLHMTLLCLECYAISQNPLADKVQLVAEIEKRRERSKQWLEMTVATEYLHLKDTSVSVVGDLSNWNTYMQCEVVYHTITSNSSMDTDIRKVLDKVIGSLSSHHSGYDVLHGQEDFFSSVMHFLLRNGHNLSADANEVGHGGGSGKMKEAEVMVAHLLMHYLSKLPEYQDVLILQDWKQYRNWLKPSDKKKSSKASSSSKGATSAIPNDVYSIVLPLLQKQIMTDCDSMFSQLQQANLRNKSEIKSSHDLKKFVGLHEETSLGTSTDPMVWRIVTLALLTYFSTQSPSQESLLAVDWNVVVSEVDDVFRRSIELFLQILLDSVDNNAEGNTKALLQQLCNEGFQSLVFTSTSQSRLVKSIQQLYRERLWFYFYISAAVQQQGYQSFQEVIVQPVLKLLEEGLRFFPEDTMMHHLLVHLHMSPLLSRRGYLLLKSFHRQQSTSWYMPSSPERWFQCKYFDLQVEFHHIYQTECNRQLHWSEIVTLDRDGSGRDLLQPDWKQFMNRWKCHTWSKDSYHRLYNVFEHILSVDACRSVPLFWRLYLYVSLGHCYTHYHLQANASAALDMRKKSNKKGGKAINNSLDHCKKIILRAIHHCGYCKILYMDILAPLLRPAFSEDELVQIMQLMEEQGIYIRG